MSDTVARGSKIALKGFSREKLEELKTQLTGDGMEVVVSISKADLVVVGPDVSDFVRKSAEKKGIRLMELDAFLSALQLTRGDSGDAPVAELPTRAAVEVGEDWVRILDVVAPRNPTPGRSTPPASGFKHFCLDAPTLRTARTIALAHKHGVPCLLEGETATSKTSVILWVAHLTNSDLIRINLNGQTDTSELVGRYVPSDGLPEIDVEAFEAHLDLLEDESRFILERARNEGRDLTLVERQQIAANERLPTPTWQFKEGYIPRAMRHGHWVIMDEINLAEPQVLERLNPVLERPPSLVLTEGDGTRLSVDGPVMIKQNFRMFATMNPAEYAGRTALSPAYRDRWQLSRFVESPDEGDFHSMLRSLVFGEQPEIAYGGVLYKTPKSEPLYPELQNIPDIDGLLERLAIFHSSVSAAAGMGGNSASIGRTRRERYVFTRRTLLTTLELINNMTLMGGDGSEISSHEAPLRIARDVIERLYLDRIQESSDRDALNSALTAAGLNEF